MKHFWNRITLMRFATDEDDGRIPAIGWIGSLLLALVAWATWVVAVWIVRSP